MSAWYVLNAMGVYSFCPGDPRYAIGRPLFDRVRIRLENGRLFTVIAENNAPANLYVQAASMNGKPLDEPWFSHADLMAGGTLTLKMGSQPPAEKR